MKITAAELAEKIGAKIIGDSSVLLTGFVEIEDGAAPGSLVLAIEPKALKKIKTHKPFAVVLAADIPELKAVKLVSAKGKELLIELLTIFNPDQPKPFISETAVISPKARIGKAVTIYPGVVVGDFVTIGDGTLIYPNAVIYQGCQIGRNCIIHGNAVIGADGFGFIKQKNGIQRKVPQKGIVRIGDNVEIGAGTTIDRATIKETVIGNGTKMDNKVQVGHNTRIGENCIVVAAVNIGGSVVIEDGVVLAGGAGVVDNVSIGKNSVIAAYTVVTKDVPADSFIYATPVGEDYTQAIKCKALYNKLPELAERIKKLESK